MKIALGIDFLRRPGGAQLLLLTLSEELCRRGFDITVMTNNWKPNDEAMSQAIVASGARIVRFPARHLVDPCRFARLVRFVRRERFDLIHTHLSGATILGALAGRACGIPVIATLHSDRITSETHFYHGLLETLLLRRVREVTAVGPRTAALHRTRLGRPVKMIPNAAATAPSITDQERRALRVELGGRADGCIAIFAGRLTEAKGLPDLLAAMSILRRAGVDLDLALIGDGPLAADLKAQAAALRVGDRVHFLGIRDDVPRLLRASDVYACSSKWEGLPIAVLEAMVAGLPVVATGVGDISTVLSDDAGLIVPPGDPEALAGALARLATDPGLRRSLADAGHARASTEYSGARLADRFTELYQRTLGANASEG